MFDKRKVNTIRFNQNGKFIRLSTLKYSSEPKRDGCYGKSLYCKFEELNETFLLILWRCQGLTLINSFGSP